MTNNKFMGTFDTESEVLQKIEELKATGSREEDMYVMARDKDQISMVRGRTDVEHGLPQRRRVPARAARAGRRGRDHANRRAWKDRARRIRADGGWSQARPADQRTGRLV